MVNIVSEHGKRIFCNDDFYSAVFLLIFLNFRKNTVNHVFKQMKFT